MCTIITHMRVALSQADGLARAHVWCLLYLERWADAVDTCNRLLAVDPRNMHLLLYKVCGRPAREGSTR